MSKYHHKKSIIDWSKYTVDTNKYSRWHPRQIKTCLIDNCDNSIKYLGLCGKHYQSYRQNVLGK
jgi:hypothetical protein